MTRLDQLKTQLAEMDESIRLCKELEWQGYDRGMMLALTRLMRARVAGEIEQLEAENEKHAKPILRETRI